MQKLRKQNLPGDSTIRNIGKSSKIKVEKGWQDLEVTGDLYYEQ